jgi:hypothetical protein
MTIYWAMPRERFDEVMEFRFEAGKMPLGAP